MFVFPFLSLKPKLPIGLCTLWSLDFFELVEIHASHHWILVKIIHLPLDNSVHLFNVYIPNNYHEKLDF
jgi:hypothetical protein